MSSVLPTEAPAGWRRLRFDRVVHRSKESGKPNFDPLSVYLEDGVVPRSSRDDNHNRLGADMSNYLVVRPGDIVFNKLRTWQGGLGVSRHLGVVSPAYFVCRPVEDTDSRYYHYLLRSNLYLAELTRLSKFMPPSQFDIAWDDLRTMSVLLPPLRTQQAIADYLDTETARIDALITKKRRMIDLLQELTLEKTDHLVWSGGHPKGQLKRLVPLERKIMYGIVLPGPNVENGALLIKGGDTKAGRLDPRTLARTAFEIEAKYVRSRVKTGDLLFAIRGGVGDVEIAPPSIEGANITQDVARISPKEGIDGRWLLHALRSPSAQRDVTNRITGATIRGINIEELERVEVPVPPPEVQGVLVERLERNHVVSTGAISLLREQLGLLAEHRQALITAAVTGELEIPGVAA